MFGRANPLHEALVMLNGEGLRNAWSRHEKNSLLLRKGLERMGFEYLVPEDERFFQLNSVLLPSGIHSESAVRNSLLRHHRLEIGAGLGELAGKIWRIGLMGYSATTTNVEYCLGAIEHELRQHVARP